MISQYETFRAEIPDTEGSIFKAGNCLENCGSSIRLAAATAADFEAMFGTSPPWRIRGVAAREGGRTVALGGLAYTPDGQAMAFYAGTEAVQRFPVAITRAVATGLKAARARGVRRIVADCDTSIEAAARWLARLGFRETEVPNVWIWEA